MTAGRILVPSLLVAFSARAGSPGPVEETLLHMRVAGAVVAGLKDAGTPIDLEPNVMTTLDQLSRTLDPEIRRWLPTRDGWGRPIRIVLDSEPVLFSFGADGRPDLDYAQVSLLAAGSDDETIPDRSSPDRDIIFSGTDFDQKPEPPPTPAETAMEDIRAIGTAMEACAVDLDRYPRATGGLLVVSMLAPDLEGIYIKELPVVDPWGHPYFVVATDKAYAIVSAGADGLLESSYEGPDSPLGREGVTLNTDLDADIVLVDGVFVAAPIFKDPNPGR